MSDKVQSTQIRDARARLSAPIYPSFTRNEVIADAAVHFLGIVGSITAFATIYLHAFSTLPTPLNIALVIYGVTVIALFTCSAAYHLTPFPEYRPFLRLCDQSAIFFKIAGSYTPIVVLVGTPLGYVLLALIWSAAIVGSVSKFLENKMLDKHTVLIFLAMGWASLALVWPMFQTLQTQHALLIVLGGAIYSIGVIFHQWEGLRYQNAIWHTFVLTASMIHLYAIAHAAFATA
ncbi:MAG: hemolysin III family protein [Pseudomonadota bacterium]